MAMLMIPCLIRDLHTESRLKNLKEWKILWKLDLNKESLAMSIKLRSPNINHLKGNFETKAESLWQELLIETISFLSKRPPKTLSMAYPQRKINMMSSRQFIQGKICLKRRVLGLCIWNLTKIMTQDNRKNALIIGIWTQLISDSVKLPRTSSMMRWSKWWHLNHFQKNSHKLPLSKLTSMIISIKKITN